MSLLSLVKNFARPGFALRASPDKPAAKSSLAGPMIAWSGVGQPRWTPRRYESFAEEGFRKNVIAYRCVMQIATSSAAIPWLLYDDAGQEVERHPLLGLLQHPNPLQDGVSFLESVYTYLQIAGNAYIEAVRPHDGASPVELYVLRPDRMKVVPGPMGLPQGYQYSVNGQVTNWSTDPVTGASNILHLKIFHPLDDWYGMAPMESALLSIDQHNAAGSWNQALLNQGARPAGALVYAPKDGPNTLTDDQMQRLREELGQLYQGSRNAGRPMILEGGLDWREMSLSPKDMDWLAGRNNAARDIAQAFGVPAQLIGIPDSQTYSNMAEARMAFYEETVLPLVTRTIAGFDHWLTPMFDENLQLDFDPDQISALTPRRDAQWSKINNARFLTRNEQREAAGYGPVPGGDALGEDDDGGDGDEDGPPAGFGKNFDPDGEAIVTRLGEPWLPAKFNPYHDELGRFTTGPGDDDNTQPANGNDTTAPAAVPVTHNPAPEEPSSATALSDSNDMSYPKSNITNIEDAKKLVDDSDGQYIGRDGQCASLVHELAPTLLQVQKWLPGDKVQGDADIPIGTPIATFNFQGQDGTNGYGSSLHPEGISGQSHAGIYLGQDAGGLSILNQWQGSGGPRISHIPWAAWGKNDLEGGARFYTIAYQE